MGNKPGGGRAYIKGVIMAEPICAADLEKSIQAYDLLKRLGKLCIVPDCTQHKAYLNGSQFCYCHAKEKRGLLDMDTHYRGVI